MTYTGRSNSYHLPKNSNRKLNVSRSKQGKWTCLGFWLIVFLMVTPAVMIWYIYHIDILDMPHTIRFMKQITSKYSISATSKLEQTLPDKMRQEEASSHSEVAMQQSKQVGNYSGMLLENAAVSDKGTITKDTEIIEQNAPKSVMDIVHDLFLLGTKDPDKLIYLLNTTDPLSTKVADPDNFTCDSIDLLPRKINDTALILFRNHTIGYYVFFQHLRKAGGTSFCELARSNMRFKETPPYYCMPDNKGSLATPPWDTKEYLTNHILQHQYRVVANEWDVLYSYFFDYPGAIFATTIRNPLDRWYSQYRFEHLEHRDGSSQSAPRLSFFKWYQGTFRWTMGTNYYIKTFIGDVGDEAFLSKANKNDFYWTYHKYTSPITWEDMKKAIDNFSRLSLILVLEWIQLPSTQSHIENVLGWEHPIKQVLPHEVQAFRKVKKSIAVQDVVSTEEYMTIARDNVFDLLFYEVAKRMYLERIRCHAMN